MYLKLSKNAIYKKNGFIVLRDKAVILGLKLTVFLIDSKRKQRNGWGLCGFVNRGSVVRLWPIVLWNWYVKSLIFKITKLFLLLKMS